MSRLKHTPGPWEARKDYYNLNDDKLIASVGGIGIIRVRGSAGKANMDQDARLIAACPAMLEALKSMVSAQHAGPITDEMKAAWDEAKKAIALATGWAK